MALIIHFSADNLINQTKPETIQYDGSVGEWLGDNIQPGKPFSVFEGQPCAENDITFDAYGIANIDYLLEGHGEYIVIETPAATIGVQIAISVILAVVVIALTPKPDLPLNVNRSQQSPNNALSSRSNRARPLERIPDIKGCLKSIPDIAAPTYSTYEANTEVEHGYYCVGRKQLQIEDLKDGDTPLDLITGATAGIYYPFNSPNAGAPDVDIGGHTSEPIVAAYRSNQVNGITLGTEFDDALIDATKVDFTDTFGGFVPDTLFLGDFIIPSNFKFSNIYEIGTSIILTNVFVNGFDISGTYLIVDRLFDQILKCTFVGYPAGTGTGQSGDITSDNASEYTDWAYMTAVLFDSAIINVTAPNGMYKDTGLTDLEQFEVEYEIQLEGVDVDGVPDGSPIIITDSIIGNDQRSKGETTTHTFTNPTRFRQRAKRTTVRFTGSGTVVDTIKLEDLYGILDIDDNDFGDVTTIQTRTKATPSATAVKERQINCIATEMLFEYLGAGVFDVTLSPNKRAVQSFITDAIDPVIGNRTLAEIEADDLLALDAEITTYFENSRMGEFSYTFDSTDISFQEYTQTLFDAVFCIAFREAGKISALLEQAQTTPAMLFTHRSKLPNSETHTRNFNPSTINDGVEFTYVDPNSNTDEVIYIPTNKSAVNPKKFNIAGIRSEQQALIRARREFNKLEFSKINLDVTVTAEGRYIRPNDMIAVVKGTRVMTYDGEVLAQDALTLTLSADVAFIGGTHTIVLKDETGETESIVVTAGAESDQVIMAGSPTQTIRTGIDSRRTEFSFGPEATHLAERWLTQEIDISDKWFVQLKAINYDDNYYINDTTPSVRPFSSGFSSGFS